MALIDFECTRCSKKFFEIMDTKDANNVKCPECQGEAKRVYKGKFYGKASEGGSKSCGGSCGTCSGCR